MVKLQQVKKHLAIFRQGAGEDILNGKKTIETRFSKVKLAPFGQVSSGDLVYIKPSGKDIIGQFQVKKVIFYDGMTNEDLEAIKKTFGDAIVQSNVFWENKLRSNYGTLIFIGQTTPFITAPLKIIKKDQRGWVVLD